MYSNGISTRKMAEILEELFHNRYSKSTISRIIEITVSEINTWRSRPLEKRYIAIFMDAMFFSLGRDTIQCLLIGTFSFYSIGTYMIFLKDFCINFSEYDQHCRVINTQE